MRVTETGQLSRYAVALAAFGVSLAIAYALKGAANETLRYMQFCPAVVAAAWFGGFIPGALVTAASGLSALLLRPGSSGQDFVPFAVFVATGLAISWLSHKLHSMRTESRTSAAVANARAERLDAILNMTADGIIVIDVRGRIEAFNPGAQRLFGYPESEVVGRNVSLLMPSPHHEDHDKYLERYLATGEARIIGVGREVTGRRRDGTVFPVHLSVGEMRIAGERKFTGMLRDLTRRVHLEDELGASEARWRAIVESAVDGIIVIDAHGRVETFNPAAERLFGYTADEVLGRNVDMLMPSPYREEHDSYLSRYLATGRAKIIGIGREVQGRRKDGSTFPLHLSVGQITVGGERRFTGILHDLSDRVRLEEQVREQATLAKLGEMAAVIAHEVKNPLAGIRGAMQVIASRLPPEGAHPQILKEIIGRIDALDAMMKDLLLFARPPKPRRVQTDVLSLIEATADLLGQDPAMGELRIEVGGSAPSVFADPDMLRIVFQNLMINSAHAMQGKGRIKVEIGTGVSTCQIAFMDEGPGIPPEIREKIFAPFFTTKSRGSGLGLPTTKRLIEAQEGRIAISCPPAGGTTIMVELPLGQATTVPQE